MCPVEGRFAIMLPGDIARIMALPIPAGKSKKAALDEKAACLLTMVAGTRNQRYLHLDHAVL